MYHTSHTRSRSTVRSLLLASRQGSRGLSIGYPLFLNTASRGLVNENGAVVFAETLTTWAIKIKVPLYRSMSVGSLAWLLAISENEISVKLRVSRSASLARQSMTEQSIRDICRIHFHRGKKNWSKLSRSIRWNF